MYTDCTTFIKAWKLAVIHKGKSSRICIFPTMCTSLYTFEVPSAEGAFSYSRAQSSPSRHAFVSTASVRYIAVGVDAAYSMKMH